MFCFIFNDLFCYEFHGFFYTFSCDSKSTFLIFLESIIIIIYLFDEERFGDSHPPSYVVLHSKTLYRVLGKMKMIYYFTIYMGFVSLRIDKLPRSDF